MLKSIFSRRKPEEQMSKPNMSYASAAPKQQNQSFPQQSTPRQTMSFPQQTQSSPRQQSTPQPRQPQQRQTPMGFFGQAAGKAADFVGRKAGKMQKYRGSQFRPPANTQPTPPKAPRFGQMSGPQSTAADAAKYGPITQVPQPEPQREQPQDMNDFLNNSFLQGNRDRGQRQANFAEQQRAEQEGYLKEQYGLANEHLRGQMPIAEERLGQFKGDTEAMIADLIAGGERQKGQTEDYYGDAMREAAQSRRAVQGQTQRTFANLGTLDSYGEGSFQQATENADSDFNRFTQQTLRAKADKLSEIESAVRTGERQARQTIATEQSKLNELSRNIEFAVANNNLELARELTDAFNQTQQRIYDIEDFVNQGEYEFSLAQQDLQNEMSKIQSFTPEFMATGNPTNQAEYEFFIKNQDTMKGLYGGGGEDLLTSTIANTVVDDVARALDTLESKGRGAAGWGGRLFGNMPESSAKALLGDIKSIQSNIGIDKLLEIKASGAGLGQVPQSQLEMLASVLGRLDNEDKPERLIYNLNRIDGLYRDIVARSGGEINMPSAMARDNRQNIDPNQFIR